MIEAYLGAPSVSALLELDSVEARYGPVQALHGVSLEVDEGELVARARRERRREDDDAARRLRERCAAAAKSSSAAGGSRARPDAAARAGIAHVPEGRGTFSELSVWDNLRLGAYTRRGSVKDDAQRVFELLPAAGGAASASRRGRSPAASSRCSRSGAR